MNTNINYYIMWRRKLSYASTDVDQKTKKNNQAKSHKSGENQTI